MVMFLFSTDFALATMMKSKWIEHFFKEADGTRGKIQKVNGKNMLTESNSGLWYRPVEWQPSMIIPCPTQRIATQASPYFDFPIVCHKESYFDIPRCT